METIFIDTHVAVWLHYGNIEMFPPGIIAKLESSDLFLSPISFLEMDYLYEIKRVDHDGHAIFNKLASLTNLKVASHPWEQVIREASTLKWTRDVFDRLIVAHTKLADSHLITKDKQILKNFSRAFWKA